MNKDRLLYAGEFLERNLFEPLTAEDLAAAAAVRCPGSARRACVWLAGGEADERDDGRDRSRDELLHSV